MYFEIVERLLLHNPDDLISSTFLIALLCSSMLFIAIKHLESISAFNLVEVAFEVVKNLIHSIYVAADAATSAAT